MSETQLNTTDETSSGSTPEEATRVPREKSIWTPAFLLAFALVLVLGLSVESILTQSWANRLYVSPQWIIQAHVILAALGWLALGLVSRSNWIRTGCIFGVIGTAFMTLNIIIAAQGVSPSSTLQSYINVATCVALLGAYIGLSVEGTLLASWDMWLFLLIPFLGTVGVALTYFLTPQPNTMTIENAVATAALIACLLVWWLRPSCWRKQPGPTLIFGLIPAILLIAALSNSSMHSFFMLQVTAIRLYLTMSQIDVAANANNCLFAQVVLLALFLGCLRMARSELCKPRMP